MRLFSFHLYPLGNSFFSLTDFALVLPHHPYSHSLSIPSPPLPNFHLPPHLPTYAKLPTLRSLPPSPSPHLCPLSLPPLYTNSLLWPWRPHTGSQISIGHQPLQDKTKSLVGHKIPLTTKYYFPIHPFLSPSPSPIISLTTHHPPLSPFAPSTIPHPSAHSPTSSFPKPPDSSPSPQPHSFFYARPTPKSYLVVYRLTAFWPFPTMN